MLGDAGSGEINLKIQRLRLRGFRNAADLAVDWGSARNLIIGENGAGKTNLLEALFIASHGKSYRTRQERELIQWGAPFATLTVEAQSAQGGSIRIEAQYQASPEGGLKTLFKVNGLPVKNRSELVGKIPTVTFFLADLLMLRGTPEDRRNALDSALSQLDPVHVQRLIAYHRVRKQKAHWLKLLPNQQDPAMLQTFNQQLAQTGACVMAGRMGYLNAMAPLAQGRYETLSSAKDVLTLGYHTSLGVEYPLDTSESALEALLTQKLQDTMPDELRRGQVLSGPHRDDVRFYLSQKDATHFGSQGQQRSIVLATKLSEIALLEARLQGESPVLLLDDVMAELDPRRQGQLVSYLEDRMQVFLTTTHLDAALTPFLQNEAKSAVYHVDRGILTRNNSTETAQMPWEVCDEALPTSA